MKLDVLIVEDDREIRAVLHAALVVEGFEVSTAVSVSEAQALFQNKRPDLIILDLGLPDGDGAQLLRQWRAKLSLPIIVISARQAELEKIELLDAGADDYLVKPFGVNELLARVRVALRHRGTTVKPAQRRYEVDHLAIDLDQRSVRLNGQEVRLTPTEFRLLARLARSAGQIVIHRQLLADVWGPEFQDHTHYLRIYMGNLRAKLERNPAEPRYLLTEPGVGYRLAAE